MVSFTILGGYGKPWLQGMHLHSSTDRSLSVASSRRMIVGTLISLLLPVCCLFTMGSVPSSPSLVSVHAESRALVSGNGQPASSVLCRGNVNGRGATVQSLPQLPHDLTIRRNVRSQAPSRVRRAQKASRSTGPMIGRRFWSSTKPPERAALCILCIRRGRSPPAA